MQLYVKWDSENEEILFGPQGAKGDGVGWYPYVDAGEIINLRTQARRFVFVEEAELVMGVVEGDAELTWLQIRQANYGGIEEQLDMLWHDINNGTLDKNGAFYTHIKAVKDGAPKGD